MKTDKRPCLHEQVIVVENITYSGVKDGTEIDCTRSLENWVEDIRCKKCGTKLPITAYNVNFNF
jgi:hypothetical protein